MNDNELITAVRQSVAGAHTTTPVEQILRRGRAAPGAGFPSSPQPSGRQPRRHSP
jgi:hypothetical protein